MRPIKLMVSSEKNVQTLLQRAMRKAPSKIIGVVPVSPLYHFCKKVGEDGVVFRYMFPLEGELKRIIIYAPEVTAKTPIAIRAEITTGEQGRYVNGVMRGPKLALDVNLKVVAEDRIIVTTSALELGDVEFCGLFYPNPDAGTVYKLMMDQVHEEFEAQTDELLASGLASEASTKEVETAASAIVGSSEDEEEEVVDEGV
jgi:hypothetical protein